MPFNGFQNNFAEHFNSFTSDFPKDHSLFFKKSGPPRPWGARPPAQPALQPDQAPRPGPAQDHPGGLQGDGGGRRGGQGGGGAAAAVLGAGVKKIVLVKLIISRAIEIRIKEQ